MVLTPSQSTARTALSQSGTTNPPVKKVKRVEYTYQKSRVEVKHKHNDSNPGIDRASWLCVDARERLQAMDACPLVLSIPATHRQTDTQTHTYTLARHTHAHDVCMYICEYTCENQKCHLYHTSSWVEYISRYCCFTNQKCFATGLDLFVGRVRLICSLELACRIRSGGCV